MILPAKDWIKFTDAITRHGANPCVQLAHAGLFAEPFFNGQTTGKVIGPVDMDKESGTHVSAMDEEDMARIANDFAEAALCAVQSGFNQVMVQCCHGWLLAQFLSPAWNTRTDSERRTHDESATHPQFQRSEPVATGKGFWCFGKNDTVLGTESKEHQHGGGKHRSETGRCP